ncbi:MAG: hypothetical protein H5T41_10430 [Methanomassiliicoccales archaeon]|nr:hypothetical protein [Methanomassiliicoccales archaeon]
MAGISMLLKKSLKSSARDMKELKKKFNEIERKFNNGEITPVEAYTQMKNLKHEYYTTAKAQNKGATESWGRFIGHRFQKLVYESLKVYVRELKKKYKDDPEIKNLTVFSKKEVKKNKNLIRKLTVKLENYSKVPNPHIVIAAIDPLNPVDAKVLAIIWCKTTLKDGKIYALNYWKSLLLKSNATKHIKVYLVTPDNDKYFDINPKRRSPNGKSRFRAMAEEVLDGIYIMRDDFRDEWENEKVKRYEKIVNDLVKLMRKSDC